LSGRCMENVDRQCWRHPGDKKKEGCRKAVN
jgi:hypothetical protein